MQNLRNSVVMTESEVLSDSSQSPKLLSIIFQTNTTHCEKYQPDYFVDSHNVILINLMQPIVWSQNTFSVEGLNLTSVTT